MPSPTTIGKTRAAKASAVAGDAKKRKTSSSAAAGCVSVSSTAIVLASTPPSAIPLAAVSSRNSSRSNEEKQMDKTMTRAATTAAKQKQSFSPSSSSNDTGMGEDRKQKATEVCTQLCNSSARPLSFAELVAQGVSAPVPEDDLSKPAEPGTLRHTKYGNDRFEHARRYEERRERAMEDHKGKSLDEAIEDHAAHEIDFTAPVTKAAGKKLGLQDHLKNASQVKKGHEKKMATILLPTSEFALPQQNSGLSGAKLTKINYNLAYFGNPGAAAGFQNGELGTIVNAGGQEVDAARSKATKELLAMGLIPELIPQKSKNCKEEIPQLCLDQGKPDSIPANSLRLIDEDNNSIDHSNETDFKRNLHRARGFEVLQNFDAVVASFYKDEAKNARKDTKKWRALRNKFISILQNKKADIRFTFERILDGEVVHLGPRDKRLKLASYRFKFVEDEEKKPRFELADEVFQSVLKNGAVSLPKSKRKPAAKSTKSKRKPAAKSDGKSVAKSDGKSAATKRKSVAKSDGKSAATKKRRKVDGSRKVDDSSVGKDDWDRGYESDSGSIHSSLDKDMEVTSEEN